MIGAWTWGKDLLRREVANARILLLYTDYTGWKKVTRRQVSLYEVVEGLGESWKKGLSSTKLRENTLWKPKGRETRGPSGYLRCQVHLTMGGRRSAHVIERHALHRLASSKLV